MKLLIILVAVVATITNAENFRLPIHKALAKDRSGLSHSRYVMDYYRHLDIASVRRHDLSNKTQLNSYKQAALNSDHVGFTLPLRIAGFSYNMSMDTGSSDIFIKGQKAPGYPTRRYKSKTNYKKTKNQFSISYLDGQLNTYQQTLPVQFLHQKFQTPLLVAYTAPQQFKKVEGLIGLSFPSLANHRPTFIETLINNKIITKYAFGMNLNLIQSNRSFVSFGQKDPQLYQGQLYQYPIPQSFYIKIEFQWIKIGNSKNLQVPSALLDTGNTCISIPYHYNDEVLNQFNTKYNKCVFSVQKNTPMFSLLICKIRSFLQLPLITLSIGGNKYTIEKQFYLRDCTQKPNDDTDVYYCNTYIETVKHGGNDIFLGDAFFNRFYTFFDLQNKKVGIAKNKQNLTIKEILEIANNKYDPSDWVDLQ